MEPFLDNLRRAQRVDDDLLKPLQSLLKSSSSLDESKDYLNALIDAYSPDAAEPVNTKIYKQAVMDAIAMYLRHASDCRDSRQEELSMDDLLMLAMFFNELATISDEASFQSFCGALRVYYTLCVPYVFGRDSHAAAEDKENEETIIFVRTQLQSLRSMMTKRLSSVSEALRRPTMFHVALDCLRAMLQTLWQLRRTAEADAEIVEIIDGLTRPVQMALEEQVLAVSALSGDAARRTDSACASPLLLSSVLGCLEDTLWMSQTMAHDNTAPCASFFQHLLGELLSTLNKYLTLHKRSGGQQGGGSRGAAGSGSAGDVFRAYAVQHAIQRLLSVALKTTDENVLTASLKSGSSAAIAAFGGEVPIMDRTTTTAPTDAIPDLREVALSWTIVSDNTAPISRVRRCESVLAQCDATAGEEEGDADLLDDDAALLLGGMLSSRDKLLKSSLGNVAASALVDMVCLSLRAFDMVDEDAIRQMHHDGLNAMQYTAARRAQAEELERVRRMDQQGVDAIPAGKLIEHVKEGASMQAKGMHTLRRVSARAKLERSAFRSILSAYAHMKHEAESTVRETQALISRCLVQMPSSMSDAALDDICLLLQKEFKQQQEGDKKLDIITKTTSYYQLMIQVLFMFYASLAPVRDRDMNSLLFLDDAAGFDGPASMMHTRAELNIDTENPIAFLHDVDTRRPSYASGRKRSRDSDEAYGSGGGGGLDDGEDDFSFLNDTVKAPCAYSHALCRVLELAQSCQLKGALLDVLLQAPVLTRYIWYYLYRHFCLSSDKNRCVTGYWLVTNLATRRTVYRSCAVNLLVHLCMSKADYPRRLAILQVSSLLSAGGATPIITEEAEALLVRYSKKQIAAIPGHQFNAVVPVVKTDISSDVLEEIEAEQRLQEEKVAGDMLGRHLGLFLMLCVRQPRQLFSSLLDVYKQCLDRGNDLMARLLPENLDVRRMTQRLLKSDPSGFIVTVMPFLRRYSKDAPVFVHTILWALGEQLREMCLAAAKSGSASSIQEDYRKVAVALLGHAKAMYEGSSIPVGDEQGSLAILHDIRFVAPFLSFIPASELRQNYLRSFLSFVQVQLQYQRRAQQHQGQQQALSVKERSAILDSTELRTFIKLVVKEVLVKSCVQFDDGVARGLSPLDLFVFFHKAPQQQNTAAQQRSAAGHHTAAVKDSHGILDAPKTGAADTNASAVATHLNATLPPIGVATTKEIISVCMELTRTFDDTTTLKLFGPEEVQRAIKKMMQTPPFPPQLMMTVLLALLSFPRSRSSEFVRFVVQHVLTPLERASTWETDPQLWRGAVLFTEKHYRECSGFLVNLPDQVLTQALRDHPALLEQFREEHGNNASFGHIIGNL